MTIQEIRARVADLQSLFNVLNATLTTIATNYPEVANQVSVGSIRGLKAHMQRMIKETKSDGFDTLGG